MGMAWHGYGAGEHRYGYVLAQVRPHLAQVRYPSTRATGTGTAGEHRYGGSNTYFQFVVRGFPYAAIYMSLPEPAPAP